MELRNYVYISKRKLDVYLPQIQKKYQIERAAELRLKAGPIEAAISIKDKPDDSDHKRIEQLVSFLRKD